MASWGLEFNRATLLKAQHNEVTQLGFVKKVGIKTEFTLTDIQ